jgi:hypothetical protein
MNRLFRTAAHTAFVAALATAVVAAPGAHATTMIYQDVSSLASLSSWVVVGTVTGSRVYRGNESRITTEWTVKVDQTLRGREVGEVRFTQWAGTLDGLTSHIAGDASFFEGERVVLFLRGDAPEKLFLTAMGQSKFSLQGGDAPQASQPLPSGAAQGMIRLHLDGLVEAQDNESVEPFVIRNLSEIAFVGQSGGQSPLFFVPDAERMTLAELARIVAAAPARTEGSR